jgi:pimeloyl-ACP methyl ester carboxylesterase
MTLSLNRRYPVGTAAPTLERPTAPPTPDRLRSEWRALREPLRLITRAPRLLEAPRGDGRLTIDLPGYLAPEASLAPLRSYLRLLGHRAESWGLGTNRGDPEALRYRFIEVLEARVAEVGGPANLVAWSLGGVVAREVARLRPDLVHRVVCLGSPLIGGPKFTAGARNLGRVECDRIEALQEEMDRRDPVSVPLTTIYSRRDGIVDWRASLDHYTPGARHVEVRSTHLGLVLDPDVWRAVAEALGDDRSGE